MARDTAAPAGPLSVRADVEGVRAAVSAESVDAALAADHRRAAAEVLGCSVDSLERIGGGRNSRVYRVRGPGTDCAAKFYFGRTADGRDRMAIEYSAFDFLWRHGVRSIPRPLKDDPQRQIALYEFIDGGQVEGGVVTAGDVDQLAAFMGDLKGIAAHPASCELGTAAEAFFSVGGVIENITGRFHRMAGLDSSGPAYDALREFLARDFEPALARLAERARRRIGSDAELDSGRRTLSPSDLGFHNALRRPDGRLVFLDFEYFGWDDPAKSLSDALLHPRMRLSPALQGHLARRFAAVFDADPDWRARVETVYPLFGLKWCMILLNEFRPDQLARRRFVDRDPEEAHALQMRQLNAARELLARVDGEHERFPFWETR
jgi:hypothetical protein